MATRRELRFDSLDEVVRDAEHLLAVGYDRAGNWDLAQCCGHLAHAIRLTRAMRDIEGIQNCLREVGRLENEADAIYRNSDSALFADPPDILLLIKWRELYGWLEETIDACKDAALVISEIIIKGA